MCRFNLPGSYDISSYSSIDNRYVAYLASLITNFILNISGNELVVMRCTLFLDNAPSYTSLLFRC